MDRKTNFPDYVDQLYGASCAALHFSGAIKSLPYIGKFPIDVTIIFFSLSLITYIIRAFLQDFYISTLAGLHLFFQALLNLYFLLISFLSNSATILHQKLFEINFLGFIMTLLSLSLSSASTPFRSFLTTSFICGILCSIAIPLSLVFGFSVRGGPVETDLSRVQYQLVGLLLATASVVAATSLIETWPTNRIQNLVALYLLIFGSVFVGGRAGFIAQIFSSTFSACLMYQRNKENVSLKPIIVLFCLIFVSYALFYTIFRYGVNKIVLFWRISTNSYTDTGIRVLLWSMAASNASLFGLGTAGFAPSMGFGDLRRWYPHNLVLEALVEAGLPGFMLFCMLFLTAVLSLYQSRHSISAQQLSVTAGFVWIFAAQILTSTDLGNRMAWFWLGMLSGASCKSRTFKVRSKCSPKTTVL